MRSSVTFKIPGEPVALAYATRALESKLGLK